MFVPTFLMNCDMSKWNTGWVFRTRENTNSNRNFRSYSNIAINIRELSSMRHISFTKIIIYFLNPSKSIHPNTRTSPRIFTFMLTSAFFTKICVTITTFLSHSQLLIFRHTTLQNRCQKSCFLAVFELLKPSSNVKC